MWTPSRRADFLSRFERDGWARLEGAVAPDVVAEMRERVWLRVRERSGLGPDSRGVRPAWPPSGARSLQRSNAFAGMASPTVRQALDALLGVGGWLEPDHWGMVLLTFPADGAWALPHKVWHLDFTAPGGPSRLRGAQVFLLLDRVDPRGGGTLVAAGSHRAVARFQSGLAPGAPGRSADIRRALRREVGWLRELWSPPADGETAEERIARLMDRATRWEDGELRAVELTGQAGDVFVTHPWAFHAPAPNTGERPRLVLTERLHAVPGQ